MQTKKIVLVFLLFFSFQFINAQEYADKIDAVLDDANAQTRGKLSKDGKVYSLFYFDVFEKDTHAKFLQEKGYHGGGPSWLALLYTAFNIYEDNIIDDVKYGLDVSGITFKSYSNEDLIMISKVIALIKSDEKVMAELIEDAKKLEIMK